MRASLVIASVLLAGVALEVAAYRIDNYENPSQSDPWTPESAAYKTVQQRVFDDDLSGQHYESGHGTAGLVGSMVEKIAAFQKIAAPGRRHFGAALTVDTDAIKLSDRDFVTFYNATVTRLDDGQLEYAYVNVARDVVMAQYRFDRVEAAGSFKSNVHGAKLGRFDVVMNGVTSNVSAGLDDAAAAPAGVEPARFRSAEATVTTADGAETRAFDGAMERRYLAVLQRAVAAEVAGSVAVGRMKREARRPMTAAGGQAQAKLFDMSWTEDGVSMDMPGVGYRGARVAAVSVYRESDHVYRTRCLFALAGLEWTSPLTVGYAGRTVTARSVRVGADEVNVHVTVHKPYGGGGGAPSRSCGQISAHVEVAGLRYDYGENVPSEFAGHVQDKLQRFIEHSLEHYVQRPLQQELCNINGH